MKEKPVEQERFPLEERYDPKKLEETVRLYWEEFGVKKYLKEREVKKVIGYIEGPPTLNGLPHIGHVRGRLMKDLWHRHESMKGIKVLFNGGWDTQGLPVELEAEKELGLTGSKAENIRVIGEEKLVETCKSLILKYHDPWLRSDRLLGLQMDDEEAYWTYRDDYIEREWKYLEAAYKNGLLGEGFKVVPYCPSCQTSLSHEEVGLGYETVEDPSLYYKVKLKDRDAYLLVWTTMPFTIVTDELVGVNPDADYIEVIVGKERWVVAEPRLDLLSKELHLEMEPVPQARRYKGKELEGLKYIPPLLDEVPGQRSLLNGGMVHEVVAEDFVDVSTGSGIVHLSPANGEQDFEVASRRGKPVFNPIDDRVHFTDEAGLFAGRFVRDADDIVVDLLRSKGLLVRLGRLTHEYPLCWRSEHKLVYVARREYFYWVDRIGGQTLGASEGVEYFFESPKNRFVNIVKEARPWNITRERVWGAPLPVWRCDECGEKIFLFSRAEIVKNALELPDGPNFELHRPWIDRVIVKCLKCGGRAKREPFVLDTWHNSGAAPLASLGEKRYQELVPVPFLTEGIDQTRGWAYTLLVLNVLLTGMPQAPFSSFLFQGLVLDERGEKMSKSKGNSVAGLDVLTQNSVDLTRFYLLWKAGPSEPLIFIQNEMSGRPYQVLNTLYHLHLYYSLNSSYDSYIFSQRYISQLTNGGEELEVGRPERWLVSMTNTLIEEVSENVERRRYQEAARLLETFLIDTLSQKYVPMTRGILWDDSEEGRKKRFAVYTSLAYSLEVYDRLAHPFIPFITEYLHKAVFQSTLPLIALQYPKAVKSLTDRSLEKEFEDVWNLVSLSNSARMKAGVKRRWPLKTLMYFGVDLSPSSEGMLAELANVRKVLKAESLGDMKIGVKARLTKSGAKKVGRRFDSTLGELERTSKELFSSLSSKGWAEVKAGGERLRLEKDDVLFEFIPEEGFIASSDGGRVVSLEVARNRELIAEGLVRDIARRLQSLRKERGYRPTDIVSRARVAGLDEETRRVLEENREKLLYLVRAREFFLYESKDTSTSWKEFELDGRTIYLDI
jgi:isoleucyl-tRNA synthetase